MRRLVQNLSVRAYRALLIAYPKSFREQYGREMALTFRALLLAAQSQGGAALMRLWMDTILDAAYSALRERSEEMRGRVLPLIGAAALGILIAWVDSRPRWDDKGITVGVILLSCAMLGAVSPKHPWQWALAVGLWLPLVEVIWMHNYGSLLALVPAFLGAYLGAGLRSLVFPPPTQA